MRQKKWFEIFNNEQQKIKWLERKHCEPESKTGWQYTIGFNLWIKFGTRSTFVTNDKNITQRVN